ncbi:non-hydrolyzing UDP-N-acetylglucosamine 2-epimerase [Sabulicella rubraurantiaca]|uniref:non-hydrolyzing UDP-N-acetylglucosamine 2-epimerase n=1 Tax=Sabulicella rubraurantiaca TaxID=2811429 RepID=UPI001F2B134F|nr:UDP-N-acetylglucosamine 2-epimerase (non-hydrolyzing) [Sabulicella rubraurantiaca]
MHLACVVGTRPEAIKLFPVIQAARAAGHRCDILSTGQHREMLDQALEGFALRATLDLGLMRPGQGLSALAAGVMAGLDPWLVAERPDWLLVQGDTTSAMAGALAGFHARIPVAHVEGGLRSHDLDAPFPEEANRAVIGRLARLHLAPTETARQNLLREGVPGGAIRVTGNTGVDALLAVASEAPDPPVTLDPARRLVLVTAHRRESQAAGLQRLARAMARLASRPDVQMVVPLHRNPLAAKPLAEALADCRSVTLLPPQNYRAFVALLCRAALVITDSGGVQEEAATLGVPVLVAREETDRPEAMDAGTTLLVGTGEAGLLAAAHRVLDAPPKPPRPSLAFGDGRDAPRILAALESARPVEARLPAMAVRP